MSRNIRIAITGGIGSGKSTVAGIIADCGYKTLSLDSVYHELLKNEEFVCQICDLLNVEPVIVEGRHVLDRRLVAEKVFSDESLLNKLNNFTHERIVNAAFDIGDNSVAKNGIVFYEVPLLFEGGFDKLFDKIIVIMRDLTERIACAALRDGVSVEEVKKRIKKQLDYEKTDLSLHIVIVNDGNEKLLEERVKKVLSEL